MAVNGRQNQLRHTVYPSIIPLVNVSGVTKVHVRLFISYTVFVGGVVFLLAYSRVVPIADPEDHSRGLLILLINA